MGFEVELQKMRDAYQQSINELKQELRVSIGKESVLMQTVNIMADSIAKRNLIIEGLCAHIDNTTDVDDASPGITQNARELIQR